MDACVAGKGFSQGCNASSGLQSFFGQPVLVDPGGNESRAPWVPRRHVHELTPQVCTAGGGKHMGNMLKNGPQQLWHRRLFAPTPPPWLSSNPTIWWSDFPRQAFLPGNVGAKGRMSGHPTSGLLGRPRAPRSVATIMLRGFCFMCRSPRSRSACVMSPWRELVRSW